MVPWATYHSSCWVCLAFWFCCGFGFCRPLPVSFPQCLLIVKETVIPNTLPFFTISLKEKPTLLYYDGLSLLLLIAFFLTLFLVKKLLSLMQYCLNNAHKCMMPQCVPTLLLCRLGRLSVIKKSWDTCRNQLSSLNQLWLL